jgi:hypothetical protein
MSLKAGGGNRGTIFSTLTYSVDMMAVVEECMWWVGEWEVVVLWWCVLLDGSKVLRKLKTPHRLQGVASGWIRNRTGWKLTIQAPTCVLFPASIIGCSCMQPSSSPMHCTTTQSFCELYTLLQPRHLCNHAPLVLYLGVSVQPNTRISRLYTYTVHRLFDTLANTPITAGNQSRGTTWLLCVGF